MKGEGESRCASDSFRRALGALPHRLDVLCADRLHARVKVLGHGGCVIKATAATTSEGRCGERSLATDTGGWWWPSVGGPHLGCGIGLASRRPNRAMQGSAARHTHERTKLCCLHELRQANGIDSKRQRETIFRHTVPHHPRPPRGGNRAPRHFSCVAPTQNEGCKHA